MNIIYSCWSIYGDKNTFKINKLILIITYINNYY